MKRYLLDTNICVYFLRGRHGIAQRIAKIGWENCCISEITIAELQYGAENSNNAQKNLQLVEMLCDSITVLPIRETFRFYAQEKANKDIKTTDKKFQKTTKLKEKKSNERLQAEQEKQTKLQKQVSIVGVLESVFNLTTSIGTVMMAIPWTAAAGAILVNIGLKGTLACGLTKATIYAAHGDIKSAFITLGTTIMTATTAAMGAGGAAKSALGTATASLNVINSAAKVGASVRQVQALLVTIPALL